MRLKLVINFISLLVLTTSSVFAFELSPNHFGGFGKVLKGKSVYKPSQVFPFYDALTINSNIEGEFYSETLPSILTEDSSKFYLYAKDFNAGLSEIYINNHRVDLDQITVSSFRKHNDEIELIELLVSNTILKADEPAIIRMTTDSDKACYVYQVNVSNQFTIFPTQHVIQKSDRYYRTYALMSHCPNGQNGVTIELSNQTFDFDLNKGYQLQTFELPLVNKQTSYRAKIWVNGLLYGKEDIEVTPYLDHQIHLIPVISSSRLTNYSSEYPLEVQIDKNNFSSLPLDHESFSRQVNYSIQESESTYPEQIGFLQEESILKYSTILQDKPYPSRKELNRMMDINIKTLGYFQRDKYGYPDAYFSPGNTAYIYENANRELLVYKQYNSVNYQSIDDLKEAIIHHEYKLSQEEFPFKQNLLFIHIESEDVLKELNSFINTWNTRFQSPQLTLSNFNQFGKLFVNRNRTKLDRKVNVESPFKLNYTPEVESVHENADWKSVLSNTDAPLLQSNDLMVFNPLARTFGGVVEFKHESNTLTYATLLDGTHVNLQQYKPNHYYILIPEIKAFELKKIQLHTSISTNKKKIKSHYLAINKRSGIIQWQFNGNKFSKKKEALFVPSFNLGITNVPNSFNEGYLKQKGTVFTEYERLIKTDNGDELKVNTFVFHQIPLVKYKYSIKSEHPKSSLHTQLNFLQTPTQYSIDRIYKEEHGYSKFGNHNIIESEASIFLVNKTKILLSSPQKLRWEYNSHTFNTNEVGFVESSTYPTHFNMLLSGTIDQTLDMNTDKSNFYELDVVLGDENDQLEDPLYTPFLFEPSKQLSKDIQLFKIDNTQIEVVAIHPTEKDNQFFVELKNTSDNYENTSFTPRKHKSTVYECLFSGKKTGIVKGKLEFEPQELKTIRFSL